MINDTFWVAVSTIIFGFIIYRLVKPTVIDFLDQRTREIAKNLGKAEQLKLEADRILILAQQNKKIIDKEAIFLQEQAKLQAEFMINNAQEQLSQLINKRQEQFTKRLISQQQEELKQLTHQLISEIVESVSHEYRVTQFQS